MILQVLLCWGRSSCLSLADTVVSEAVTDMSLSYELWESSLVPDEKWMVSSPVVSLIAREVSSKDEKPQPKLRNHPYKWLAAEKS